MYIFEFQKRGVRHAHILVWLSLDNKLKIGILQKKKKLKIGNNIDRIFLAKLLDSALCLRLFDVASSYMMHVPCGSSRHKYHCKKND